MKPISQQSPTLSSFQFLHLQHCNTSAFGMEQSHNPPGRTVQAPPTSELSSGMLREKRRRNRKINSCDKCRRRKIKCSRTQPCRPWQIFSRKCVYASANTIKSGAPSSSPSPADSSALDTHGTRQVVVTFIIVGLCLKIKFSEGRATRWNGTTAKSEERYGHVPADRKTQLHRAYRWHFKTRYCCKGMRSCRC
jgi:hypothetical protein